MGGLDRDPEGELESLWVADVGRTHGCVNMPTAAVEHTYRSDSRGNSNLSFGIADSKLSQNKTEWLSQVVALCG
jgi:hypothetical protein